ncbi:hypothetical protein H9P43_006898 [Blastocladiella emersonii ATCC 22665]|nr:hypothetical protein H9P43_006898 [Blastocladiella emersonii ATCC 22665]
MGFNAQKVANRKRTKRNAVTKPAAETSPVASDKPAAAAMSAREALARRRAAAATASTVAPGMTDMLQSLQDMLAQAHATRDPNESAKDKAAGDAMLAELAANIAKGQDPFAPPRTGHAQRNYHPATDTMGRNPEKLAAKQRARQSRPAAAAVRGAAPTAGASSTAAGPSTTPATATPPPQPNAQTSTAGASEDELEAMLAAQVRALNAASIPRGEADVIKSFEARRTQLLATRPDTDEGKMRQMLALRELDTAQYESIRRFEEVKAALKRAGAL